MMDTLRTLEGLPLDAVALWRWHKDLLSALDETRELLHELLSDSVVPILDAVLFSLGTSLNVTFSEAHQVFLLWKQTQFIGW